MIFPRHMLPNHLLRTGLVAGLCFILAACQTSSPDAGEQSTTPGKEADAAATDSSQVDVSFLLSMTFNEAKRMSAQSVDVPPFYQIAADEITVLQRDSQGRAMKVNAKGRVFMQTNSRESIIALGQEAYVDGYGEVIVRGRPLLRRGRSLVEGLSDHTVFYVRGLKLEVIGKHRLVKQETSKPTPTATGGSSRLPTWNVTPTWRRAWRDGPNPLLPALSPDDVPSELRATPLIPLPEPAPGSDAPTMTLPDDAPLDPGPDPGTEPPDPDRPLGRRPSGPNRVQ